MQDQSLHHSHDAVRKRLKRAEGHLRRIIAMIEEQRACVDVAQQLHAVEKAICQAKRTLIQDHIDHCLEHVLDTPVSAQPQVLDEFKEITKYL